MNEVDANILARYRASWVSTRVVPHIEGLWFWCVHLFRVILRRPEKSPPKAIDHDKRTEALARFILALSDQQLVTGLAILVGALGSRCTLSTYEFLVVVSLAWFSSTTHLATLNVLREYFIQHQIVRNVRVIGMVTMMILLAFGLIIGGGYDSFNYARPLQCAIAGLSTDGSFSVSTFFTLLFLVYSYTDRIGSLFDDQNDENHPSYSNRERLLRLLILVLHPKLKTNALARSRIIKDVVAERRKRSKKLWLQRANKRGMKLLPTYFSSLQSYSSSFLASIPALFFGLSYGISQVSVYRWDRPPNMTEDAKAMSFGQIVPLFLLILPALTAAEIFYGKTFSTYSFPYN